MYGGMRFHFPIVFLAAMVVLSVSAQNSSKRIRLKPLETTVCEILRNPSGFNNKLVRVRGQVSVSQNSGRFELLCTIIESMYGNQIRLYMYLATRIGCSSFRQPY
jgi:hypothetical protein